MGSLVVVKSFSNIIEAQAAKGLLDSCGIQAEISASDPDDMLQHTTSYNPNVDLKVPEEDLSEARSLLKENM